MSKLFFVLIGLCLLYSCNDKQKEQSVIRKTFDSIRDELQSLVDKGEIPSVSVAVYHNDSIIWLEALGYANMEKVEKATPNTIYPIASITKSITATAIMILSEKGLLDLDDPITKYFDSQITRSYFKVQREITIRDLLNHTSGLGTYFENQFYGETEDSRTSMALYKDYNVLFSQPGEKFEYSNMGYLILGEIIEKVTGTTYSDFIRSQIFEPLKMNNSCLRVCNESLEQYAQLYGIKSEELPFVRTTTAPAGDIYSTAYDLMKFGASFLDKPLNQSLLTDRTEIQMRTIQNDKTLYRDPCNPYGLGWFFEIDSIGYNAFSHEGGLDGSQTILKVLPSENLVVVVLINLTFIKSYSRKIADDIIKIILPDYQTPSCIEPKPNITLTEPSEFTGNWSGKLFTKSDTLDIDMDISTDGNIYMVFKSMQTRFSLNHYTPFTKKTVLHSPSIYGSDLTAWILEGLIPSDDWNKKHHIVHLQLHKKVNKLQGSAMAIDANTIREGSAISYYLEFEKRE